MKHSTSIKLLIGIASFIPFYAFSQSLPDVPLQTSANSPAANIMFILDDSGSMAFDYIPDELSSGEFYRKNYSFNSIAYNPSITYTTWKKYDQSLMTGGTTYENVYADDSLLTDNESLRDTEQAFFLPINSSVPKGSTNPAHYYRYEILYTSKTRTYSIQRCSYRNSSRTWVSSCVSSLPSSRTLENELVNYATWYSYHRTRIKVAKAGVMSSFSELNGNVRLGYDSIWNRSSLGIPVGTDNGLFRNNNKITWFNRVTAADARGGTPLHGSLVRAGKYFQSTSSSGPWGPESGASQFSCRQNFTILTTDGYWNDDTGYNSSAQYVGNADGTDGEEIVSSKNEKYKYTPSRPFGDNFSDTLADISMFYWKKDLRPDLTNNVSASVQNPAFWQHMTTYGISIGLKGTLDPKVDRQAIENGSLLWKNPWKQVNQSGRESWANESPIRIDDLWHASINGRGTFNVATDPDEFAKSLKSALNAIQKKLASGSNVSTSSTSLQTDTRIFHATYYSGIWTGEVSAFDISNAGVSQDPTWIASEKIKPYSQRKIFTMSNTGNGESFPNATQKVSMLAGLNEVVLGVPYSDAESLANYIKGDRSNEENNGGVFRNRISLLGDIVHSSPVYSTDTDTLYIGANDGMLHAFNASTGSELFAYVPRGLNFKALGTLAHPDYLHKYFVDGQIAVSNKKNIAGGNYLVGALGHGGKGVYALNISSPASFGNSHVMWDNTSSSDPDMGYVTGEPIITKGNDGSNIVIVSNGLNSTNGTSTLYIYKLETGQILKKIVAATGGNGLSSPRGWDKDGNGTVDTVYAGDLKGNVWKFDVSSNAVSGWIVDLSGRPLFKATDSSGTPQPITGGLTLGMEPFGNRMWVLFGTGKYINTGDISSSDTQSVYGVIDQNVVVTRNDLQSRKIEIVQSGSTDAQLRSFETYSPLPPQKLGWVLDLGDPYPGERMIERGFLTSRVFVFPTVVPMSSNPCESSGKGFLNAIDAFTGTTVSNNGSNFEYFDVGSDGDRDNDSIGTNPKRLPVGSIETNIGMTTKPILVGEQIIFGGSDGGKSSTKVRLMPASAKRLSWREVVK